MATGSKDSQHGASSPRTAKQAREFKRQVDELSGSIADLSEAVRTLRTTTGEETLDLRARIHEFDRRLTLLERAVGQLSAAPEAKADSQ